MNMQLMIRLIKANQRAGRVVSIEDKEQMVNGGVMIDDTNPCHKMTVGQQRFYVSDVHSLIKQGQIQLRADKS